VGVVVESVECGFFSIWCVLFQFADNEFAALSGCRIVRIATNPAYQGMGYGTHALQLLLQYYSGGCAGPCPDPDPRMDSWGSESRDNEGHTSQGLLQEVVQPRHSLPPLLTELHDKRPEPLHYVGVAFGLTAPLLR